MADKEPDQDATLPREGDVEEVESGEEAGKGSMPEEVERAAEREDEAAEG